MHQDRRGTVALGLLDGRLGVVDVGDVLRGVGNPPHPVQKRGVQHRGVQLAPCGRPVRTYGAGQQALVQPIDEMEAAVAREQEGVALGSRLGERVERPGERPLDVPDPGVPVEGRQRVRDRKAAQQTVDGAYTQRVAGRVHEQHQPEVPGTGARVLPLKPQIGGPAVVAVGDQGLAVREARLDTRPLRGVGDGPEPVGDPVLGRRGQERGLFHRPLDDRRRTGRTAVPGVAEEQRFEMRPGRTHQVGAVRDDVRHHVLVRQHDPVGRGGQGQRPDHPALQDVAGPLLVDVEHRFRVLGQDTVGQPALQGGGGLLMAFRGAPRLRKDQAHDVVRVQRLQVVQTVGPYDDVVGR